MPRTIYKYPVPLIGSFYVDMPKGATILHTASQSPGAAYVWALVDTEAETVQHEFRTYGTGHPMPDAPHEGVYVGTFFNGPYVWHLFDKGEN